MPDQTTKDRCKQLVLEGRLDDALAILRENTKEDSLINQTILLSAKYRDLQQIQRLDLIPPEEYQRKRNQLRLHILNLADEIFPNPEPSSVDAMKEVYKTSIARIAVLKLLYAQDNGLTIRQIHEGTRLRNRKFIIFTLKELIAVEMVERFNQDGKSLNRLTEKGRKFFNTLNSPF